MNKKIEFDYEDKAYTLEYDRRAIKIMEANGLDMNKLQSQPLSMIEILWAGAFLKNHKNIKPEKTQEIYSHIPNKEELHRGLMDMVSETYDSLVGDSEENDSTKNIQWKMA